MAYLDRMHAPLEHTRATVDSLRAMPMTSVLTSPWPGRCVQEANSGR